jgi:hypothetical protein
MLSQIKDFLFGLPKTQEDIPQRILKLFIVCTIPLLISDMLFGTIFSAYIFLFTLFTFAIALFTAMLTPIGERIITFLDIVLSATILNLSLVMWLAGEINIILMALSIFCIAPAYMMYKGRIEDRDNASQS